MTSSPIIRRATLDDVVGIVGLLADDPMGRLRGDPSLPLAEGYVRAFHAIARDPHQFLAVVEEEGEIIGTLQLTFIPGLSRKGRWRGQIEAVRIAAHKRGSGLGHTLLTWAINECRARGCRLVQLTSDKTRTDAHRFYTRLGFEATHEGYKLALEE